jgi:hypothetical protein
MSFLRAWFLLTGTILAAGLTWSFAPILIPVFIIGGMLGLLVLGVIAGARWIEARRPSWGQPSDGDT